MDREWWGLRLHLLQCSKQPFVRQQQRCHIVTIVLRLIFFQREFGTYNVHRLDKYKEEQCDNNFFILVTAFLVVVCSVGTFWDVFRKTKTICSRQHSPVLQAKAQVYSFEATLRNRIARLLMQRIWVAGKAS